MFKRHLIDFLSLGAFLFFDYGVVIEIGVLRAQWLVLRVQAGLARA